MRGETREVVGGGPASGGPASGGPASGGPASVFRCRRLYSNRLTPHRAALLSFDRKVYVAPPNQDAREAILRIQLGKMPHASDVDVPALARACHGFSGAEVVAVCREGVSVEGIGRRAAHHSPSHSLLSLPALAPPAALLEMRRDPANAARVSAAALLEAARAVTPNITEKMLAFYAAYAAGGAP